MASGHTKEIESDVTPPNKMPDQSLGPIVQLITVWSVTGICSFELDTVKDSAHVHVHSCCYGLW